MNGEKHHCRLCAGYSEIYNFIDLSVNKEKSKKVNFFLTSLRTKINFSPASGLPTVICFVCFNFLNLIQQFLDHMKETQVFLTSKLKIEENGGNITRKTNTTSLETSHDDDESNSSSDSSVFDDPRGCEETFEPLVFEPELLPVKTEIYDVEDTYENPLASNTEADTTPVDHKPKWRLEIESPEPFVWTCMETGCSKTFETAELLAAHHTRDHCIRIKKLKNGPLKDEDVTCKECNIVFTSHEKFWRHNFKLHRPENHKICEKCGKLCTTKQAFINHSMCHETEKSHVCRICNKSFLRIQTLRDHIKFHMNIKEYQCNECGKKLRSKASLICHMMTHTGLKPYSCKICTKPFRTNAQLKNHGRTHGTGDVYRYECKPCGRIFSCWGNCNKHMKRIHNTTIKRTMEQTDKNPKVDLEEWKKTVLTLNKRGTKPKAKVNVAQKPKAKVNAAQKAKAKVNAAQKAKAKVHI